jgi:hypothetical protein
MTKLRQLLLAFLAVGAVLAALTGCTSPPRDSSIPWSRPAEWEGRIPGMGGP